MSNICGKEALAKQIAADTDYNQTQAKEALEAVLSGIEKALKNSQEVRLTGFGTFKVTHVEAREGRNPQTGESMTYPARNQPKFKAGTGLKDALN